MGRENILKDMLHVELSVQAKDKGAFKKEEEAFLRPHMFTMDALGVSGKLKATYHPLGNIFPIYDIETGVNPQSQVCTS